MTLDLDARGGLDAIEGAPDALASPVADAETPDAGSDGGVADVGSGSDAGSASDDAGSASDAGSPRDAAAPADGSCAAGSACAPIPIGASPFTDSRDTRSAPGDAIDRYACAPSTDESGPEVLYRLEVSAWSVLLASVDDRPGDGVDVDLHLLPASPIDGSRCFDRDNVSLERVLAPGTYHLSVDTWVDSSGRALAGAYVLTVELRPLPGGRCAIDPRELPMYWADCAGEGTFDCRVATDPADGQLRPALSTPALGPVVREAHLVTVAEDFGGGWPASLRDRIDRHYSVSQAATGYMMTRSEPWAPAGEGGSSYGQGAIGTPLPVVEESWYVNMYWRHRPARGTRVLLLHPRTGRAVVAAAGFETGPGSNTAIGGVTEEAHHHLGTQHRSNLVVGFLVDQTLPFGPITCP